MNIQNHLNTAEYLIDEVIKSVKEGTDNTPETEFNMKASIQILDLVAKEAVVLNTRLAVIKDKVQEAITSLAKKLKDEQKQ